MQILHDQSLSFNFRLTAAFILKFLSALGYFSTTTSRGEWVLTTWNFPGVLKKEHIVIPDIN